MPKLSPANPFPKIIHDQSELENILTTPRLELVDAISSLPSPLLVLGAGGKMGPSLAVLARKAAVMAGRSDLEIIAVSRYTNLAMRDWLESQGVLTIAADLMNPASLPELPDAENIIYMVGVKFGTHDKPALTWAMNTLVAANICRRYPHARISALSSANVYPLSPVALGGAVEGDPLNPIGEYANSVVCRERIFEYFSEHNGTKIVQLRLSYALDLRYGVVVDIAKRVFSGQPVDVTNGYFNAIWQGDANELILRSLPLATSPVYPLNLSCQPPFSVREIAQRFGELMNTPVIITGKEADDALIINTSRLYEQFGTPSTPIEPILHWVSNWITSDQPVLNKPTHFQVRNGQY
jgi:nucleoside-diphosphate-sugar epimerase